MLQSNILREKIPGYYIKDVAVNWHGTKMAVCSNNTVNIWSSNSEQKWIKEEIGIELDKQKIVERLSWAHPEFGQVLAVCTKNEITIWEFKSSDCGGQWFNRTTPPINEPRYNVINDVKFSPSYSGIGRSRALDLAYCTDYGHLKILRCKDAHLLKDWETLKDLSLNDKDQFTCLAWNVTCSSTMIAVGTSETSSKDTRGEVKLFEYDDSKHEWLYREVIAKTYNGQVNDVAFAPNPGRSFNTLAIASSDLQIIDFKTTDHGKVSKIRQEQNHVDPKQNKIEVWKLSWSSLGTTLCATGDDGLIRLWKNNNKWECTNTFKWDGMAV